MPTDYRTVILETIIDVAPDVDVDDLDPTGVIHEQLDLDSMDMLNIAAGIYDRTGINIPERDYTKLTSLELIEAFLERAAAGAP